MKTKFKEVELFANKKSVRNLSDLSAEELLRIAIKQGLLNADRTATDYGIMMGLLGNVLYLPNLGRGYSKLNK